MAENHSSISENKIIEAIKSGNTKMRPRWYFVVQGILIVLAAILTFFLLILAVSFIIFALQENGGFLAAGYGVTGWETFFTALPWSIILLCFALVLILIILLKRYSFIYKRPSLYLILILIIVITLGSFIIEALNFHRRIENNDIPLIESVYQYETAPKNYIYRGKIIQFVESGFVIQNAIGQTSTFLDAPGVNLDLNLFKIGEFVMIFGQRQSTTTIDMYGVQFEYSY